MKNTCIKVLTDPDISWLQGRNGCFDIKAVLVRAWGLYGAERLYSATPEGLTVVSIDGISAKRGIVLNGGLQFSIEAMDKLAIEWCTERGLLVLTGEVEEAVVRFEHTVPGSGLDHIGTIATIGRLLNALAKGRKETNDKRRTG